MPACLLGLGSNLGDCETTLNAAVDACRGLGAINVLDTSRWHTFPPVGGPVGQGDYLNGAMVINTELEPAALLDLLQAVEHQCGRKREVRWGPRRLDIDLLLYDLRVVASPDLRIPHPRMSFRRFVLVPAFEIAADWVHPLLRVSIAQLLCQLDGGEDMLVLEGGTAQRRGELELELMSRFQQFFRITSPSEIPAWRDGNATWLRLSSPGEGADRPEPNELDWRRAALDLPKLVIRLIDEHCLPLAANGRTHPGAPTLEVEAAEEHLVLAESLAAVEAVWPGLGRPDADDVE